VLAYCGLRSLGGPSGQPTPNHTSGPTTAAGANGTGSSAAATTGTAAGTKLKIVGATGFDPQGDGSEDNSLAPKAYDNKPTSGWTSDTYRTAKWGGLKKGVGLRLDLGSPRTVHTATLRIGGTGAAIELLAVNGSSLSGSTVLAKQSNVSGSVTLTVTSPTSSQYVVIWFTTPGQFAGGYRAEVDDVQLR
jgi:eukaryotic-like serine/threonine-protein kinase